jgi:hypothetical protein
VVIGNNISTELDMSRAWTGRYCVSAVDIEVLEEIRRLRG